MTRFTVIWRQPVLNHLARLWLSATDRDAVRHAADTIEAELGVDAHCKGTAVRGLFRRLVIHPLDVLFVVLEADRQVHVMSIRRAAAPSNGALPPATGP